MPPKSGRDTIRILVATDNHVGYLEDDPIRGDDSWKTFHEIMCLAPEYDADMVLLAGDLFHENKPSRKSMYQVMRSLRMNCYGEKPCELQILSDTSSIFQGSFNHANYEDPDINVAIPAFSIHGNHDDPSGSGRYSALDLLSVAGLVNYFGRIPENDNIVINPILLQKNGTKLALYGMSNVRDERLFRTFRDGKVKFLRPAEKTKEWFNLMALHQNHHGHTQTGYLPENFLQDFLDLLIWGHEHECIIDPRTNLEMGFQVMQPGSSIATSLAPGEAISKHVAILSITGREFEVEKIRLKTVRPFAMREIILSEIKELKTAPRKAANRTQVTEYLMRQVEELIDEAKNEWLEAQDDESLTVKDAPLPLVRIRVDYTAPEGGNFEIENPQRFSNRFVGKVANVNDVVQFHRRKAKAVRSKGKIDDTAVDSIIEELGGSIDKIKVEKLVQGFLESQTLNVLPQNGLGDAVGQFVDKDDKQAVELFVAESLRTQVKKLLEKNVSTEDEIRTAMTEGKSQLEELFAKGLYKQKLAARAKKGRPDDWDSDIHGHWEEEEKQKEGDSALFGSGSEMSDSPPPTGAGRGRGRGRARGRGASSALTRKTAVAKKAPVKKAAPAKIRGRGKRAVDDEEEQEEQEELESENEYTAFDDDDEDEDVVMADVVDDDEDDEVFKAPAKSSRDRQIKRPSPPPPKPTPRKTPARPTRTRQATLPFSQSQSQATASQNSGRKLPFASQASTRSAKGTAAKNKTVVSDDDIEDDVFEPAKTQQSSRSTRSRK